MRRGAACQVTARSPRLTVELGFVARLVSIALCTVDFRGAKKFAAEVADSDVEIVFAR